MYNPPQRWREITAGAMEDMLSQAVVAASAEVMPLQAEDIMVAGYTGVVIITAAATMGREDCISASAALFTGRTIITPRRRDITVAASIAILRTHNRGARQGWWFSLHIRTLRAP